MVLGGATALFSRNKTSVFSSPAFTKGEENSRNFLWTAWEFKNNQCVASILLLPRHAPCICRGEGHGRGKNKPSTMRSSYALPLLGKHVRTHNLVFFQGSYLLPFGAVRRLIWRRVSRLDAFSGSPFPTWLPGYASSTTGTPEVGPPRSSRTRGSPSQPSNAHSG